MQLAFFIFIAGGLGALLRYVISLGITAVAFPWATLLANGLAALLLGALTTLLADPSSSMAVRLAKLGAGLGLSENLVIYAVMIGFCGSLSTFSTFTRETLTMLGNGEHLAAAFNVLASLVLSALLFFLGMWAMSYFASKA